MSVNSVNLSCPSCGAELEIAENLDRFACSYCGSKQIVSRSGRTVSLSLTVEKLEGIKLGVDKTASELAIKRLREDIINLEEGKKSIHTDKDSSIKSIRFVAKILIVVGIIFLMGGIGNFSISSLTSYLLIFGGVAGSILSVMFFRASIVYSSQCDKKLRDTEQSIAYKQKEINRHLGAINSE